MSVSLRPATAADLAAITAVFRACWRDSYAAVLPAALVAVMTDARAEALWNDALSGAGTVLVAVDEDDRLLGVSRYAPDGDGAGTVRSLYVAPWAQRLGVGRKLLEAAAAALDACGAHPVRLWVFADNAPAIAFYRRQGWRPDGGRRAQPEFGEPELRLVRDSADAGAS